MKTDTHEKEPQKTNNIYNGLFAVKLTGAAKNK